MNGHDILAITVNRWPHGYGHSFNSLYETETVEPKPYKIARRAFGRIAIANSDAAWNPYPHAAIDEAYRTVNDIGRA